MILALTRFDIASREVTKKLEREWGKYRKLNGLDLYGNSESDVSRMPLEDVLVEWQCRSLSLASCLPSGQPSIPRMRSTQEPSDRLIITPHYVDVLDPEGTCNIIDLKLQSCAHAAIAKME